MSSSVSSPSESQPPAGHVPERKRNLLIRSKMGGRILSAMMLPAFMALPPRGWGVLETTGRKTGKRRRKCVRAVRSGNQVYIVSIRPSSTRQTATSAWVLNLRAHPRVRLRMPGGTFAGTACELAEAEETGRAEDVYCETVNPFDYVSCAIHRTGPPTRAKVKTLHRSWFDKGIRLAVEIDS
ncbi:MAG TPA: nitroreductase/quinone reductase family protein [Solirubrobacteraceae bacterium]